MKNIFLVLFFSFCLQFCVNPKCFGQSESGNISLPPLKNVVLAGFLNGTIAGTGYFYCHQHYWGLGYFLTSQSLFWSGLVLLSDMDLEFQSDIGFRFALDFYDVHDYPVRFGIGVGLLVIWLGLKIFSGWHASKLTKEYNDNIYQKSLDIAEMSPFFIFDFGMTPSGNPAIFVGTRY